MAENLLSARVVNFSDQSDSQQRGFTLIEMMVVVVIIAVLAVVAIVGYTRHLRKSRIVEGQAMIAAIQARQEAYMQQNGVYCSAAAHPALTADEPVQKLWTSPTAPPAGYGSTGLNVKPESGNTYFEFVVAASTAPAHAVTSGSVEATLGIPVTPNGPPWYYVIGRANLDGNPATTNPCGTGDVDCTVLHATSVRNAVITLNPGN